MKRFLIFLLALTAFYSCGDKSLQLPQVAVSGVSDIQNHSEIWVFYKFDDKKIKAEINKNNTITSTHWIINIDKRLPMSEVIPVLQMIKAKRAKKTVHSVDGTFDYLSYSDTLDKKIALFRVDSIQYITLNRKELITIEKEKPCDYTIEFLNDSFQINNKKYAFSDWKKQLFDSINNSCIQLQFDKDLSYQNYLKYRLELETFLPEKTKVEHTEYLIKE
jgi:hypothetical protein